MRAAAKVRRRGPRQPHGEPGLACGAAAAFGESRQNSVMQRVQVREVILRDRKRLGRRELGSVARKHVGRRIVPQQVGEPGER
jgi:hypothetical protein